MLLAIDIGNTNVALGVFQGDRIIGRWRLATDARRMPDEYGLMIHTMLPLKEISSSDIKEVAICSVVPPLTGTFERVSEDYLHTKPLVVGTGVKTGIRILYDNPRDVGADRVVDAVAGYKLYGGPLIVVDFGTATVFDAISREGNYMGGAIAPGLNVAAESLFLNTSQLRRVEMVAPKSAIGRSTITSMQSGLLFGHAAMVEGMVQRFRKEMGLGVKVVATGGLGELIADLTDVFDAVNPDLTLIGLKMVYELNKDSPTKL